MECRHNRHSAAAGGRFDNPECVVLIGHIEISPVAQLPLPPARLVILSLMICGCGCMRHMTVGYRLADEQNQETR